MISRFYKSFYSFCHPTLQEDLPFLHKLTKILDTPLYPYNSQISNPDLLLKAFDQNLDLVEYPEEYIMENYKEKLLCQYSESLLKVEPKTKILNIKETISQQDLDYRIEQILKWKSKSKQIEIYIECINRHRGQKIVEQIQDELGGETQFQHGQEFFRNTTKIQKQDQSEMGRWQLVLQGQGYVKSFTEDEIRRLVMGKDNQLEGVPELEELYEDLKEEEIDDIDTIEQNAMAKKRNIMFGEKELEESLMKMKNDLKNYAEDEQENREVAIYIMERSFGQERVQEILDSYPKDRQQTIKGYIKQLKMQKKQKAFI